MATPIQLPMHVKFTPANAAEVNVKEVPDACPTPTGAALPSAPPESPGLVTTTVPAEVNFASSFTTVPVVASLVILWTIGDWSLTPSVPTAKTSFVALFTERILLLAAKLVNCPATPLLAVASPKTPVPPVADCALPWTPNPAALAV